MFQYMSLAAAVVLSAALALGPGGGGTPGGNEASKAQPVASSRTAFDARLAQAEARLGKNNAALSGMIDEAKTVWQATLSAAQKCERDLVAPAATVDANCRAIDAHTNAGQAALRRAREHAVKNVLVDDGAVKIAGEFQPAFAPNGEFAKEHSRVESLSVDVSGAVGRRNDMALAVADFKALNAELASANASRAELQRRIEERRQQSSSRGDRDRPSTDRGSSSGSSGGGSSGGGCAGAFGALAR